MTETRNETERRQFDVDALCARRAVLSKEIDRLNADLRAAGAEAEQGHKPDPIASAIVDLATVAHDYPRHIYPAALWPAAAGFRRYMEASGDTPKCTAREAAIAFALASTACHFVAGNCSLNTVALVYQALCDECANPGAAPLQPRAN